MVVNQPAADSVTGSRLRTANRDMTLGADAPHWKLAPQARRALRARLDSFPIRGYNLGVIGWSDALVYDRYGLTEDEIAIVEGRTRRG